MTIKTSSNKEYEAVLAYAPTYDNALMLQIVDARLLSMIAVEFEGLRYVEIEGEEPTRYNGYNVLNIISRSADGSVLMKLYKE